MNQLLRVTVGCLALGALAVATGPAQADSPGPYYAMPSWDQTLPAATRFIVLSNFASAAVLDRNTGLVWEKSPDPAPHKWDFARTSCAAKEVGGQMGWRLPSLPELASLIDRSVTQGPTLPTGHPFATGATGVQSAFYRSATTIGMDLPRAWVVTFGMAP